MIAKVIVDISAGDVDRVFDYRVNCDATRGSRVFVPFGRQSVEGYVIDITDTTDVPQDKLKSIISVLDDRPIVSEEFLSLCDYMTSRFHLRKIDVFRLFLPAKMRGGRIKALQKTIVYVNPDYIEVDPNLFIKKSAHSQMEVFEYLLDAQSAEQSYLNANFSAAAVRNLIGRGVFLTRMENVLRTPYKGIVQKDNELVLTDEQSAAVEKIMSSERPTLLFGVTGSGKTEVYLNCIERVLKQGKTAIMLVPEISLTPQVMRIFRSRFGDDVALLHSGLSDGERFDEWRRLLTGSARVAVGARSAIFAPLTDVGLIVIDEEHDTSYVSESNPRYITRDVAFFRAKYNDAKVVMGSATPSVESYYGAQTGRYNLVRLPHRINKREMPKIQIVNMCKEVTYGNSGMFSAQLVTALEECLSSGNQAILFLNRRGYSSYVMCKKCGYVAKCEDCDVSLVYHKDENLLKCHYCQRRYSMLDLCPNCKSPHIKQGFMGTERVVEQVQKMFPSARVIRMDNDTTRTKDAHLNLLGSFASGNADILVGTQMVAKGHDFPNVTLVGIMDADMSLHFSDFRAVERTFQLITQVAGRAGREKKQGNVILQTYTPGHYVYKYATDYDYEGFYSKEVNLLQATGFPPFTEILRMLISCENEGVALDATKLAIDKVRALAENQSDSFVYLNAMRAPKKRIQTKHRMQVLMRIKPDKEEIRKAVYDIADDVSEKYPQVTCFTEINPNDLS
ncbi:MAG: primosomal protein N' [Clostridiales bacterium]|nr:primosomal protein N' [Clostridiales bacterium]